MLLWNTVACGLSPMWSVFGGSAGRRGRLGPRAFRNRSLRSRTTSLDMSSAAERGITAGLSKRS